MKNAEISEPTEIMVKLSDLLTGMKPLRLSTRSFARGIHSFVGNGINARF